MKKFYLFCVLLCPILFNQVFAQCPPVGFPNPGFTCATAPILCQTLDGYCVDTEIAPSLVPPVQITGCGGTYVWNNPIWFAFFAGTPTITMQLTATNCTGFNNGIQAGIYRNCVSQPVALQCPCSNNFTLTSNNFIPGQIYYIFIDGCGGADCDIVIDVTAGFTEQQPPGNPGAITGNEVVCVGSSHAYSITPTAFTNQYIWTVNPSGGGTPSNTNASTNIAWGTTPGTYEVCVQPTNQCLQGNTSCKNVEVIPQPTAMISGTGVICAGGPPQPVPVTVEFTGVSPWRFVYAINGVNQPAITTSQNPYTINVTTPGTVTLVSVESDIPGPNCPGTVSGTVNITSVNLNLGATTVPSTCGQDNGSINLTVTGGSQPYQFQWSNGETTEDLSNVVGGLSYVVTVTETNGCTRTLSINLTNNQTTINLSGTTNPNTTCEPPNGNGSINLTANPNNPNYEYNWSNGETTEDLSNLPPGTYTVTVTLGVSCTAAASFTIADQPNQPNVSITGTPSLCELANGNVNITVSGGVPPYTFEWSNGETTEDLMGVAGGETYTVTVTGANGCTRTASLVLPNNNPPITINSNIIANTTCSGNAGNGAINITIQPAVPPTGGSWQIEWSNGATTLNNPNLEPGSYSVTVSGQGACTQTATFNVPDNPILPNVTANGTPTLCELSNGNLTSSASGATPPYTFEWSNGATTQNQTGVPADTYTVTVTAANGCTNTATATISNNNPPININANIQPSTTCPPANGNGSITISISPATPPTGGTWQIQWSTGATTPTITGQASGSYSVTVTGLGACTADASFDIPDQPNEPNLSANTVPGICDLPTGDIDVSVSGGVSPYNYAWSSGQTTQDLINVPAGSYSVTVTAANGCTDALDIDLQNNNPDIFINANINQNTACTGGNGSISLSISPQPSPTGSPYSILWSTGQTTPNINNLPSGSYSVTVNGGGSCTAEASFDVPNDPNLPNISYNTNPSSCSLSNGSISVSGSGGQNPYTFLWSTGQTTPNLNNQPAGSYTVTMTDATGCVAEITIDLDNNDPFIDLNAIVRANTACVGGNGGLTLQISPQPSPTGQPYQVLWSTGATGLVLNNLPSGSYSVTVSGGGSCTNEATFDVPDDFQTPNINANVEEAICGASNGSITTSVSGGATPYTYLWSTGQTTSFLINIPAGSYAVTVTDRLGCTSELFVDVPDEQVDIFVDENIVNNTACLPPFNGSVSISVTPSNTNFFYQWSNGVNNQTIIRNLAAGDYTVTVSTLPNGGGCTLEVTFSVEEEALAPIIDYELEPAYCGVSNGSIQILIYDGVPPYSFQWSNGSNLQNLQNLASGNYTLTITGQVRCSSTISVFIPNDDLNFVVEGYVGNVTSCLAPNGDIELQLDPDEGNLPPNMLYTYLWSTGSTRDNITGLSAGSYSVTVSTGQFGCTQSFTFTVEDEAVPPTAIATPTAATCGLANGSVLLNANGLNLPLTYNWSNGIKSRDLTNVPPGTYTVTVTDFFDCTTTATAVVGNNNLAINLATTATPNSSCSTPNGSVTLTPNPAGNYTFTWSSGQNTQNIGGLAAGNYTVTVSAGGTCTATTSVNVPQNITEPVIAENVTPTICQNSAGAIDVSVSPATSAPFTFAWSNGSNSEDLTGLTAGNYTLTVTDASGCTASKTINVPNQSSNFSVTGVARDVQRCDAPDGAVNLTVSPANLPYLFEWSNGATTEDLQGLSPGTYTVTVNVAGNVSCPAEASFTILDERKIPLLSQNVVAAECGLATGSINLTPSNGTPTYNFVWSNGATSQNLQNILGGNYAVTLTDANGCQATETATVPDNSIDFALAGTTSANTSCDSNTGGIDLSVTPAGSYSFQWSNNATTEDLSGLPGGMFSVTVSAGGTCTQTATFQVPTTTLDPQISQANQPTLCGEANGSINITVSGGVSPFTFAWSSSTGANLPNTEDLQNIAAGQYTVTVSGSNGCTSSASINVGNNSSNFTVNGTSTANTLCVGADGSVEITITPANNYSILWSNGATTSSIMGLAAGQYAVTVTQGVSCTRTANFTVANNSNAPNLSSTKVDATCGEATGSINLTVSGGTQPYQFLWSNNETTEDIAGLLPSSYIVTVTGADGCESTRTVLVDDQVINILPSPTPTANTACTNFNGSINLSVNPPNPNYQFVWSNFSQNQNLQNLQGGQYTVTITLGNTCSVVRAVDVPEQPNLPVIVENISPDICNGSVGGINLNVVGVSPFTYLWSNAATTQNISNIAAGSYTVTVTAGNGCTASETFAVGNNSNTFSFTGLASPNTRCGNPNGAVTLQMTPPNLPFVFEWSNGATSQNLQDLPPGNYSVTISDGGTCTAEATYTVDNNSPAPQISGTKTDVRCFGDATGSINFSVTGGQMPYQYDWSPAVPNPTNPQNLTAGLYTLIVTDAADCSSTRFFDIREPAAPLAIVCQAIKNTSMPGTPDGAGRVNINGGSAPYFVDWSPGGQQAGVAAGNFDINNLADGRYDVTVTDAQGCTTICDFEIGAFVCITRVGQMNLSAEKICGTGCFTASYDASQQVLDLDDALQFILHTGSGTTIVGEIARSSTPTFCFDASKMQFDRTYYISAVAGNAVAGQVNLNDLCTVVAAGTPITFHAQPVVGIAPHGVLNCREKNIQLIGTSTVPTATLQWTASNGGQFLGNASQLTVNVIQSGDFQLIATNQGCADTARTTVASTVNVIQAFITSDPAVVLDCVVRAVNLTAEAVGSDDIAYYWLNSTGTLISTSGNLSVESSELFNLIAQDTLTFCADTANIEILDGEKYPPLTVGTPAPLTCINTATQLSGGSSVQGLDFQWIRIVGIDTTVVGTGTPISVTQPGIYFFVGTDPRNGCTNLLPVEVTTDLQRPTANAGNDFTLNCLDPIQNLDGRASSGQGALTFSWSTASGNIVSGQNTAQPGINEAGVYVLVVTNLGNGCTDDDEVVISSTGPTLVPRVSNPRCFGETGRLDLTNVSGGTPPYRYSVNGGQNFVTQRIFNNMPANTYLLAVQDALGCEDSQTATIVEPAPLVLELSTDVTTIVLGESYQIEAQSNVPVDVLASLVWSPTTALSCTDCLDPLATPTITTTYKLEIADSAGCRASDELRVRVVRGNVFVPNIFNPTGSDGNNTVTVFADDRSIVKIRQFQIFDRWGERVFERFDFPPNDPALGWDGKFLGEYMNPAVFVWWAEVEYFDGEIEFIKGDVALIRQ